MSEVANLTSRRQIPWTFYLSSNFIKYYGLYANNVDKWGGCMGGALNIAKVSIFLGCQNCPKYCPRGLYTTPILNFPSIYLVGCLHFAATRWVIYAKALFTVSFRLSNSIDEQKILITDIFGGKIKLRMSAISQSFVKMFRVLILNLSRSVTFFHDTCMYNAKVKFI